MGGRQELQPQKQRQAQLPADTDLPGRDARISDGRVARRRPAHVANRSPPTWLSAFRALPGGVKRILARADAGFYCWEAVAAYQQAHCQFVIVASQDQAAGSSSCSKRPGEVPAPHSDDGSACNANSSTSHKAGRRPAVSWRCVTKRSPRRLLCAVRARYQLFATSAYTYRV